MPDIIIGDAYLDHSALTNPGGVYIIDNDLLNSLGGQDLDLANESNYSLLIMGAAAKNLLGDGIAIGDIDENGSPDMVLGSGGADFGSSCVGVPDRCGSVYVLYDTLIDSYASKSIYLSDTGNFNYRIDGPVANQWLSYQTTQNTIGDLTGDNKGDLVLGTQGSTTNNPVYIVSYTSISSKTTANILDLSTEGIFFTITNFGNPPYGPIYIVI